MDLPVFLNALTAFFVIIDPIGVALIFNGIAPSELVVERAKIALKAVLISAIVLVLFGNYGELLLKQLGISIHALRISGGLMLFYTAFNMVTSELKYSKGSDSVDISVFPLSMPLLAGPGSLTVSILLFSSTAESLEKFSVFMAVICICCLTFLALVLSKYVKKLIGKTGDEILRRFLGVLLAALAIQFIFDGASNINL
jgi:multiple antibiotic resistance protein